MHTLNKIAVVACATMLSSLAAGFAAEYRLVRVDHGRGTTYAMRPVDRTSTIAVMSHGRGVGESTTMHTTHTQDMDRKQLLIHQGRGQTMYVRAR